MDTSLGLAGSLQIAVYFLGLLAVAALAFRQAAGRVVPAILSLLWFAAALLAIRHRGPDPVSLVIAGAFGIQGLQLLTRGIFRPMGMPRPVGASRLVGGLLIGYALVLYPVLRRWSPLAEAGTEPLALLSLVPLTVGHLLFLRPLLRYLFIVPLALAAVGGAAALGPGAPLDPGLTASVLVSILVLLPGRRSMTDTSGDLRLETWPAYVMRTRRGFGRGLLLLLLAGLFLGLLVFWVPAAAPPIRWLAFHVAVVSMAGLGYWLWLPAWMGTGFRRLAWEAASRLRRARSAFRWWLDLWPVWILACVIVLLAGPSIYEAAIRREIFPNKLETPFIAAGSAVLVLALLYLIYRARRRLVIVDFTSYTQDQELRECAKGLASRLRNELAAISALYRTIDEALPAPSGWVIPVTIGVEDPLESLGDVAGPEAKVSIWKLEIPVGFLFRWLGRLVGGPRLTGSLHQEDGDLVLVADYSAGGMSASWRVRPGELPEEGRPHGGPALAYRLVENLGYRVAVTLGNIGSQRWEAVRHFTRGLRCYRGVQLSTQDPAPELRQAEREFILALEHDCTFFQCYYDLGVVYRGLRHYDSAEAAFRQILEEDPERREAYYALANIYWDQKQYRRAAIYARKAIDVAPLDARAWNLSGIARFWGSDADCWPPPSGAHDLRKAEIVEDFEIATALAWRSLFASALSKDFASTLRIERYFASRCATNLAITKANYVELEEGLEASLEALHLSPRTALFHLIRGEVLYDMDRLPESRSALYEAFGDDLPPDEKMQRWIYLLAVQGHAQNQDRLSIYRGFLDYAVPPEEIVLDEEPQRPLAGTCTDYLRAVDEALQNLEIFPFEQKKSQIYRRSYGETLRRLRSWRRLLRLLRELESGVTEQAVRMDAAESAPEPLQELEQKWAVAQVHLRVARLRLSLDPVAAGDLLNRVIRTLEENDHKRQIRRQGLYSLRARACLLQARRETGARRRDLLMKALADAERSVCQEPESPARRWVLAEVHGTLGDLEQATCERETALRLRQGTQFLESAAALGRIAEEYLGCARTELPSDGALRRGLAFFGKVQRMLESKSLDPEEPARRFEAHAAAHYWLGRFHLALGGWEKCICHLKIASAMGFLPTDGQLRLGVAYFGVGAYNDAESVFREALRLQRARAGDSRPASSAGSEPVAELLLSWAMACAEKGDRLRLACWLAREAERIWIGAATGDRRRELKALQHECLARIRFRQGRFQESIAELQRAIRLQENARCHSLLAKVLRAAETNGRFKPAIARLRAQLVEVDPERARRNRPGNLFGIWLLLEPSENSGLGLL